MRSLVYRLLEQQILFSVLKQREENDCVLRLSNTTLRLVHFHHTKRKVEPKDLMRHKIPQYFSISDNILSDTDWLRHKIFWGAFIFSSGNLLQPTGLLYYRKVTTFLTGGFFKCWPILLTATRLTATRLKTFKCTLRRECVDMRKCRRLHYHRIWYRMHWYIGVGASVQGSFL
jgi:hypothetical protein